MIFKKILNLNFFLIFVILILITIGTAALYSAGEGNFSPWAEKHIIRFGVLFF
jgi:rod shape determining protein RodA